MTDQAWTAEEVKDKLRRRYPATQSMGVKRVPGPWTCIEEWREIDLLALCATAGGGLVRYARVGHEVKVSRADYRSEIRNPAKREIAEGICHEFYFVVPEGLLRDDEMPGATAAEDRAEADLFVPDDVGLIVVSSRGCSVVKDSPLNRSPESLVTTPEEGGPFGSDLNALVRWASARPDPRHDGVVEEARRVGRELAAKEREAKKERAEIQKQWERGEETQHAAGRDPFTSERHVGRSWRGHDLEDACPCPQEPCGLIALSKVDPKCPQHSFEAAKTIRQSHFACDCKGAKSTQPKPLEAAA